MLPSLIPISMSRSPLCRSRARRIAMANSRDMIAPLCCDVSNGMRASLSRRWRAQKLFLCFAPAEDLIEDDRTERRGANTAHGKVAELKSQIAGTRRECRRDGDQVLGV